MMNESTTNNLDAFVWEPALVKTNMISAASEAANLILSVDETVKNPQSQGQDAAGVNAARGMAQRGGLMRGRGRGGMRM